jgi:hypothetical protein
MIWEFLEEFRKSAFFSSLTGLWSKLLVVWPKTVFLGENHEITLLGGVFLHAFLGVPLKSKGFFGF